MEKMLKIKKRSGLPTSYEDHMDGSRPGSFRFIKCHQDTGQAATMAVTTISGLTISAQDNKDRPNTVSLCIRGIPDIAQEATMANPWSSGFTFNLQKNMEAPNTGVSSSKCLPDNDACTRQLSHSAKKTHLEPVLSAYRNLNQEWLESMGYPQLSCDGLVLVNTFEEPFGDIYGVGVWSSLGEYVSYKLMHSVVALASYKGRKRFFACTGVFIEWNGSTVIVTSASLVRDSGDEIVEDLGIVVALPDGERKEGKLLHYTLHYNVALVSVDYNKCLPANGLDCVLDGTHVAAVGRCFESGMLMATSGRRIFGYGTLDCQYLRYSTCKITKAGIGGPLVTMNGDVIAMNFYDTKIGTPYLPWEIVYNILKSVEEKSKEGKAGKDIDSYENSLLSMYDSKARASFPCFEGAGAGKKRLNSTYDIKAGEGFPCFEGAGAGKKRLNRWPVPMPCWRHSEDVAKDNAACDYVDGIRSTYRGPEKIYLY